MGAKFKSFIDIAKETICISKNACYSTGNNIIHFDKSDNTKIFYENDFDSVNKEVEEKADIFPITIIECVNEGTVDAVFRLSRGLKDLKLGVLNFASAKHPGGGFETGAVAQEECLAYCSDLVEKQKGQVGHKYYDINFEKNSAFYTDTMLLSNVTFFRDSSYNLIENNVMCSVLTSPAVNKRLTISRGVSDEEANVTMKERMRKILYVFAHESCDIIVLGAFGCGVFGNKAEDISEYWKELLIDENMKKYFRKICFSIYDSHGKGNNFEIFNQKFKNLRKGV